VVDTAVPTAVSYRFCELPLACNDLV